MVSPEHVMDVVNQDILKETALKIREALQSHPLKISQLTFFFVKGVKRKAI